MAKTESDFQQIRCDECGKEEGAFYIDTDDGETLCQDCVMNLPTEARLGFDEALESSRNWEQTPNNNGLLLLRCVHCGEVSDEDFGQEEDDGALYAATEFLEKDEEHNCYGCVMCGERTDGEKEIDGDHYCDECYAEAIVEDGVIGKETSNG